MKTERFPLPPVHQWGNHEAPEPIQRMFDFDPSVLGAPPRMEETAAVPAMA